MADYTGMATISFGFILASAPTPHFIALGGSAARECPGNFYNPQAQPGHLCIYESSASNRTIPIVFDVNFNPNTASPVRRPDSASAAPRPGKVDRRAHGP